MLVKDNIPICESVQIIEYMDAKLPCKNKLLEGQPDEIKERYAEFRYFHERWEIEPYSIGTLMT